MKKETTRKTCLKCGHEFTYWEKFQSMYRLLWRMNCKGCGARYNVLVRYRLALMGLLAIPVAFGSSIFQLLGWNVWNVLIAEVLYFASWAILALYILPFLPLKPDPEYNRSTLEQAEELSEPKSE